MALIAPFTISGVASAYSGGTGSQADPFKLANCTDLQSLNGSVTAAKHYLVTGNLDCSVSATWNISGGVAAGFKPIEDFAGTLDGGNYTIKGLYINRPAQNGTGLFADTVDGAVIKNLRLDSTSHIIGEDRTGSFVGLADDTELTNIHSSARIDGGDLSGGLTGLMSGTVEASQMRIQRSSYSGTLVATGSAGGISGGANYQWTISDSYSDGDIKGMVVGGFIGYTVDTCGDITDSYVAGTLRNSTSDTVGGFFGTSYWPCEVANPDYDPLDLGSFPFMSVGFTITDSFAAPKVVSADTKIGGLIGYANSVPLEFNDVYYDSRSGASTCLWYDADVNPPTGSGCHAYDSSLTPSQFKGTDSGLLMSQWDFNTIWKVRANQFPVLFIEPTVAANSAAKPWSVTTSSQPVSSLRQPPASTDTGEPGRFEPAPETATTTISRAADSLPPQASNSTVTQTKIQKTSLFVGLFCLTVACLIIFLAVRRRPRRAHT